MNRTIVVDVEKIQRKEFVVGKGESLTLALLAVRSHTKEAHYAVRLQGKGASAKIIGLIVGKDSSELHLHTLQIHEAPETTSDLLVKSVLGDTAQLYYDGAIRVDRRAQKTDAYQRNENLLLSDGAHAESKPTLEILANDVRCTHGATVGTLSKEELWYLATRGIPPASGKRLIVEGFLESAVEKISDTIQRGGIKKKLWQALLK